MLKLKSQPDICSPGLQSEGKHDKVFLDWKIYDLQFSLQGELLSYHGYYWLVDIKDDPGHMPFDISQGLSRNVYS